MQNITVHVGILRSANHLVDGLLRLEHAELSRSPCDEVVLVGHSLGAGTACLARALLDDKITRGKVG